MLRDAPAPGFRSLGTFQLSAFERLVLTGITGLALLTLAVFQITGFANGTFWFGMFMLTGLLLMPVMLGIGQGHVDVLEPIFLVNTAYFLYFVWGPSVDWIAELHVIFGIDIVSTINQGTQHAVIAVAAMLVGYYVRFDGEPGSPRKPGAAAPEGPLQDTYKDPTRDQSAVRYAALMSVVAIICLGFAFRLTGWNWTRLLTLGQYGAERENIWLLDQNPFLNYLFLTMEWFLPALMIFLAFQRPTTRSRMLLMLGFLAVFVIYMTIGFRYRTLLLTLAPATYYYLLRRKRPGLGALLFSGVVSMLLITVIASTRGSTRAGARLEAEAFEVGESGTEFATDLRIYPPYYALLNTFPTDHDYLWGSSYAYVFLSPIPRALWPDKPDAPVRTVLRAAFGERAISQGLSWPNIGELYVNFGTAGEILGMMLFGYLMRRLWQHVRRNAHDRWALIWYSLWLPFLVQFVSRGYFVQIAQEFAFIFLPLIVGQRMFGPRSRLRQIHARAAERLRGYPVGMPGR